MSNFPEIPPSIREAVEAAARAMCIHIFPCAYHLSLADAALNAAHVPELLDRLEALEKVVATAREVDTAARCFLQCAYIAYGDDRKMCSDNLAQAVGLSADAFAALATLDGGCL